MKLLLVGVANLGLVVYAMSAQISSRSPLEDMVATERSFAAASFERGTNEAFFLFIADDGILFRPTAVNGKEWLRNNPETPGPKRSLLTWNPTFADISTAGDLGYTTGPWQFKADINDQRPAAFGHFITVWRKQADGTWKFVIDLGISHPQQTTSDDAWQPPRQDNVKLAKIRVNVEAERASLRTREREFLRAVENLGWAKALLEFGADDIRIYREKHFPFVGSLSPALERIDSNWSWKTGFAAVSISGDLGYSYGTYSIKKGEVEKGNYLRIWKKKDGSWRAVVDVASPLR